MLGLGAEMDIFILGLVAGVIVGFVPPVQSEGGWGKKHVLF